MRFLVPAALTLVILGLGEAFYPNYEVHELEDIIDGDTLNVENDTVRFLGMDTPETFEFTDNEPEEFGLENSEASINCLEEYGDEATEFVENSTDNEIVLIGDRSSADRGFFDRRLDYIFSEGDITRKLVVDGYARVYPSNFSRQNEFYMWERQALIEGKGVWGCP